MSDIREFKGYQISDSHYMTLNKREGEVEINLQECMALRLSGMPYTSSDSSVEKTVAIELGLAYNNMTKLRSSDNWTVAREEFKTLNPTLTDSEISHLSGFNSQGSNTTEGKPKKLTKGDCESIGLLINSKLSEFGVLEYFINNLEVARNCGVLYFAKSIKTLKAHSDRVALSTKENKERIERIAKEQALREDAIDTLKGIGIEEPTEDQITKLVDKLIEKMSD